MDRKSIAILVVCLALLLLWPQLVNKLLPPKPLPPGATNAVVTAAVSTNAAAPAPAATATAPGVIFDTNAPEQTLTVTNDGARYVFTSRGGGLKSVDLLKYPETVSALRKNKSASQDVVTLNDGAASPICVVLENAGATVGNFTLTRTARGVLAEKTAAGPTAETHEFEFASNYLVTATVRVQNTGAAAAVLPAREIVIGTATPLGPRDKGQFVGASWYDGAKNPTLINEPWFANRKFGCMPGTPRAEFREGTGNVVWAAVQNQFFTIVAMPEKPAQQVVVRPVSLSRDLETTAAARGYQAALALPQTALAAGKSTEDKITFFAGPKEYRTLARIGEGFNNGADLVMGYGGFFGGVSRALLLAMNWIHDFLRLPYGWAIIGITVVIKTVFWPLTAAGTRSMKRMQALQPQMKAIQEKYKDDPAKMNRKTMEFMRDNKVNPMGGCLPMLIQFPILIGFYRMIQSAIELRGAPFLWIGDLSQPDTLLMIPGLGGFPFIGLPGVGLPINLLPLIMGATQIWQIRLTPPSPGVDPAQQQMMRWMPLMMIVIFYNFSAGLALYWTVQNLLTIVQTKLTKTEPAVVAAAKK